MAPRRAYHGALLLWLALLAAGAMGGCGRSPAPSPAADPPVVDPPVIQGLTFHPRPAEVGGFIHLPSGPGTVRIEVSARGARRVLFLLAPTGTQARDLAQPLGEDADGGDGWSLTWDYPNQDFIARLIVVAEGPGGRSEADAGVYHEASSPAEPNGDFSEDAEGAVTAGDRVVFVPQADAQGRVPEARVLEGLPPYARVLDWLDDHTLLMAARGGIARVDVRSSSLAWRDGEVWWARLSPGRDRAVLRDGNGVHVMSVAPDTWGRLVAHLPMGEGEAAGEPSDLPASIDAAWWSPNGDRLLVATRDEWDSDYRVFDLDTGQYTRLAADPDGYFLTSAAGWLDDRRIAFTERALRAEDGRNDYTSSGYRADLAVYDLGQENYRLLTRVRDGEFLDAADVLDDRILVRHDAPRPGGTMWALWPADGREPDELPLRADAWVLAATPESGTLVVQWDRGQLGLDASTEVRRYQVGGDVAQPLGTVRHRDTLHAAVSPDGRAVALTVDVPLPGGVNEYVTLVVRSPATSGR